MQGTRENVYIALLRGINVGGQKTILMADLKAMFVKLGFLNVGSYIQSGNIVFSGEKESKQKLENAIRNAIKDRFKLDVEVLVLGLPDLERIVARTPYHNKSLAVGERIYLTVLSKKPTKENVAKLIEMKNSIDDFDVIEKTVYLLCRKGYAKSTFNNNTIEKVLNATATTRNLETMTKLVEMGRAIDRI